MEKPIKFLVNTAYYGVIVILILVFMKFAFPYVMPFFVGFIIAYAFHRPIALLSERSGMNKKLCSIITITVVIAILVLTLVILGVRLVDWAKVVFVKLPSFYSNNVEPYISDLLQWYEHYDIIDDLGPTIGSILQSTADSILSSLGNLVTTVSVRIVSLTTEFVSNLPSLLMKLLMIIISTYFISFDYDNIVSFIKRQMSDEVFNFCVHFKKLSLNTIGKYLLSYIIILLITFVELSILMSIAKVNNPILTAAGIAIFDIMPIVGTSTIMVPWMIIDVLSKKYVQALILLIGFIVMQIVRQFTEPRVVGQRVGLHPVLALICMYTGLRIWGIPGMFAIPITLVVLQEMHKAGMIHLYKD